MHGIRHKCKESTGNGHYENTHFLICTSSTTSRPTMDSSPARVPKPIKMKATALAAADDTDATLHVTKKMKSAKDQNNAGAPANKLVADKIATALNAEPIHEQDDDDWDPVTAAAAAADATQPVVPASDEDAAAGIQPTIMNKTSVGPAQTKELFFCDRLIKKMHSLDLLKFIPSNDGNFKLLEMDLPIHIQIQNRDLALKSHEFSDFKAIKKNRLKTPAAAKKSTPGRPKKVSGFSIINVKDKLYLLSKDDNARVFLPDNTTKPIGILCKKKDETTGADVLRITPVDSIAKDN